ncbi:NADH-quinone oxidoreductase subunit NuoK [Helicobacter sp. T3_23-1059]
MEAISTNFGAYLNIHHFLFLATLVFALGLFGMLRRKNILMLFLSSEIMLNGLNIALVAIGRMFGDANGEIFALFVVAIAASEVAIGLGLVLLWYRSKIKGAKSLDIDNLKSMRG